MSAFSFLRKRKKKERKKKRETTGAEDTQYHPAGVQHFATAEQKSIMEIIALSVPSVAFEYLKSRM